MQSSTPSGKRSPNTRRARSMKQKHTIIIIGVMLVVAVIVYAMPRLLAEPFTKSKWDNATPEMRDRLLDGLADQAGYAST